MKCIQRLRQCTVRRDRATLGRNVEDKTLPMAPTKSTEAATPPKNETTGTETNLYAEYGLSSPPRGKHRRNPKDAIKAMKRDGFGKYTKSQKLLTDKRKNKSKVLFFLYGRGFLCGKKDRVEKIKKIINNEEALECAVRLVDNDRDKDVTQEHKQQYSNLKASFTAYFNQPGAFGFCESPLPFFRVQQQGNCFLLAPCIAMGYLMQKKAVEDAAPLDLTQFVRHSFDDEKLFKYLVEDVGGDTKVEFEAMLNGLSSNDSNKVLAGSVSLLKDLCSSLQVETLLKGHGPCIVTNFEVHKNFDKFSTEGSVGFVQFSGKKLARGKGTFKDLSHLAQNDQSKADAHQCHDENMRTSINLEDKFNAVNYEKVGDENNAAAPNQGEGFEVEAPNETSERDEIDGKGNITGKHAMVLIGGRREEKSGKLWFLLQNWWSNMQLVEVSEDYLMAADATLLFAEKEYEFAPKNERQTFSLNKSRFADANNLDRAVQTENGLSPPILDRANH